MKYVHTNIISKDWKKLAKFYCKVFDCTVVPPIRDQKGKWLDKGVGLKNAHLKGVHLRLPGHGKKGPTLEIYSYSEMKRKQKSVSNRMGYGHIAFEVKNVSKILKKIIDLGGHAYGNVSARKIKGIGTLTFVYVKDPDGNLIELQNWKLK